MDKNLEIQELALEIIDMLGVALYFAGAKENKIKELIDLYLQEFDEIDEDLPYNQEQMIKLICSLKEKYPKLFHPKN